MDCRVVLRFLICVCLVGFTAAAKCVPEKCSSMNVSYPFWINNSHCGYPGFQIICSKDEDSGTMAPFFKAFFSSSADESPGVHYFKITKIDYTGHLLINSTSIKTESCSIEGMKFKKLKLPIPGPFTMSMSNKFVVIGCNISGTYTYGTWGERMSCVSSCYLQSDPPYCRYGCCEIALPDNCRWINFMGGGAYNFRDDTTNVIDSMCGISIILDPSTFTQVDNETNLFWGEGIQASYGLRLNWGIGLENCSIVKRTVNNSCSIHAECLDSPSGQGHVSKCHPGYQGNGYPKGTGCTDECSNPSSNLCVGRLKGGICHNLVGAYNCSCTKGYIGDGFQNGTGCASTNSNNSIIPAIIGSVSSFVGVSLGACGLFWWLGRRRLQKNSRMLLQKKIASNGGKDLQIFSEGELQKASKSYSTILGEGSFGKVYKGILRDGRHVAIKKAVAPEELFNEIIILSIISHRNVVKLIGCCWKSKSQFLLLVYEFVSNGTLFQQLQSQENQLTWERRLQIAIESAEAIAYMHHEAPHPIFHRDIKSSNILLDDTLTPKVADFGISRLRPSNETHLSTTYLSGTLGYLDSQFRESLQFTNKSDVYSFGVVLVELLTGEPAVKFRDNTAHYLSSSFLSAYNENRLNEILDPKVELSDRSVAQMNNMAELAKACLQMEGTARPSMRKVVEALAWIRGGTRQRGIYEGVTLVEHRDTSRQAAFNHYDRQVPSENTSPDYYTCQSASMTTS